MTKVLNKVTPFPHSLYRHIIKPVRDADEDANLFLKRFLDGPQEIWETLYSKIGLLAEVMDPDNTPASALQLLKQLVGFTGQFDSLTAELDETTLRKLLKLSIPIWRDRGTEAGLISVVRVLVLTDPNLFNWFFHHFIIDEVVIGEDWEGADPWILDAEEGSLEPFTSRLMVFDDGTLDRPLLLNVLNLFRVPSERIDVTYHPFMEDFDLDWSQWRQTGDTPPVLTTDNGVGEIRPTAFWNLDTSLVTDFDLDNHSVRMKLKRTEVTTGPASRVVIASRFKEVSGGTWKALGARVNLLTGTIDFGVFQYIESPESGTFSIFSTFTDFTFALDTFYTFTLEMEDDGTDVFVQFFVDRNLVFSETYVGGIAASGLDKGSALLSGRTMDIDVDFVHITPIPVDADRVEPS